MNRSDRARAAQAGTRAAFPALIEGQQDRLRRVAYYYGGRTWTRRMWSMGLQGACRTAGAEAAAVFCYLANPHRHQLRADGAGQTAAAGAG